MRDYYAQSVEHGVECGHSFEAANDEDAKWFADKMNWLLVGEYIDDQQEIEAMLEYHLTDPLVH